MAQVRFGLRVILGVVALLALGLIALTYVGEALSLNGLAACLPGSGAQEAEARQAYLQAGFRRLYEVWGYVRLAGIGIVVLAILGWWQSGRAQ